MSIDLRLAIRSATEKLIAAMKSYDDLVADYTIAYEGRERLEHVGDALHRAMLKSRIAHAAREINEAGASLAMLALTAVDDVRCDTVSAWGERT